MKEEQKKNKKKNKKKDEKKEQRKVTLFDCMPQEFQDLVHDYAYGKYCTEGPEHFINYVYDHREDYKNPNSGINNEGTLLMVQELFENPTGSPTNLVDYSESDFAKYKVRISLILKEVENILEMLMISGRLPKHRGGESGQDEDNLSCLAQNMHLYLYYFYRNMHWKDAQKHELHEIVEATISNMKWVLHFEDSVAKQLLERDFWFDSLQMDFFRGCRHFSEPLFALVEEEPYEPESMEAYERYYNALEEMATTVKATESYKKLLKDAQKEIDKLYMNQRERIEDSLEELEDEMAELVLKRKAIHEKQVKLWNKKTTQDIFGDEFNLPF